MRAAAIRHISITNYRVLRDVEITNLPRLAVVIGANGTGKSTLFDVFAFLKDALAADVHSATAKRGGFRELVSRGQDGPVEITIGYRGKDERYLFYTLRIEESRGRTIVSQEAISAHSDPSRKILMFFRGKGTAHTTISDSSGDSEER